MGIILGLIAVLFNPLIPINMQKEDWAIVDIIVAVVFAGVTIPLKKILNE